MIGPVQVVGVAPPEFGGLVRQKTQVWMPTARYPYLTGDDRLLSDYGTQAERRCVGRLKPGISREAAQAQFRSLTAEIAQSTAAVRGPGRMVEGPAARCSAKPSPAAVLVMSTCILLVLLVLFSACANLGNMLLARGLCAPARNGNPACAWRRPLAADPAVDDGKPSAGGGGIDCGPVRGEAGRADSACESPMLPPACAW